MLGLVDDRGDLAVVDDLRVASGVDNLGGADADLLDRTPPSVDARIVGRLIDKCGETKGFDNLTVRPCVFSVSGFTQEAIDVASEEDAILFQDGVPLKETPLGVIRIDQRNRNNRLSILDSCNGIE